MSKKQTSKKGSPTSSTESIVASFPVALPVLIVALCLGCYFYFMNPIAPNAFQNDVEISHTFIPSVSFIEKDAIRVPGGDVTMVYLKVKNEPIILLDTLISKQVPRWTSVDLSKMILTDEISGVYRNNKSAIFGTFYDKNRPMHSSLEYIPHRYEDNVKLSRAALRKAFPPNSHVDSPPYYMLSTSLNSISSSLESQLDLREVISLNPARSSVNVWLSSPGSVTPCHYDGYYNV